MCSIRGYCSSVHGNQVRMRSVGAYLVEYILSVSVTHLFRKRALASFGNRSNSFVATCYVCCVLLLDTNMFRLSAGGGIRRGRIIVVHHDNITERVIRICHCRGEGGVIRARA